MALSPNWKVSGAHLLLSWASVLLGPLAAMQGFGGP